MAKRIYEQARRLPADSLYELAQYLEFLQFKAKSEKQPMSEPAELRIVKLRGLLKGVDVSPESLASARQEMWRKYDVPLLTTDRAIAASGLVKIID
ncbi:MAG: DUF2281 domain-containing protein [Chloroflexi bacterium]|nr:DUF2281 domain-containing protein [Chloroflexota bacterium]